MSFLSFPHRHNFLAPIPCVEKAEDDFKQQTKRRPWKISIPDYRKTKIGEYQEKGERENDDGVSDVESNSSEGSVNSNRTASSQEKSSAPEEIKVCAGCDRQFSTIAPSVPALASQHQDRHRRNPFTLKCNTHDLNKFASTNRYRCMWPGCSLVVCSYCEPLLRKRREQGGAYGNLQRVREIWASIREGEHTPKQEPLVPMEVIRPYDKISQVKPTDCLILTTPIPATDGSHACGGKRVTRSVHQTVAAAANAVMNSKQNNDGCLSKGGIIIQTVEVVVDEVSIPVTNKTATETPRKENISIPTTSSSEITTAGQFTVRTPA